MLEEKISKKNDDSLLKGQAIVEFAIVLPILLAVLIGILEVGRYLFIFSSATNASRDAVRYASAVGRDDTYGVTKYNYCEGIKKVALDSAYLVPDSSISVSIDYLDGTGAKFDDCNVWGAGTVDTGYQYANGDRVKVTVTVPYKPMVNFIPFNTTNIVSSSTRTILGIIDIRN